MKKSILILLALATAPFGWAGTLGFVKLFHYYKVSYGSAVETLLVMSDEGDGWYVCINSKRGVKSYLNLRQALEIVPQDDPMTTEIFRVPDDLRLSTEERMRGLVLNNLMQLGAAANQYYLEHGMATARLADLVGPTNYVRELKVIDGEDYSKVVFQQGRRLTVVTRSGMVTYEP